jgi:hypothetical protein
VAIFEFPCSAFWSSIEQRSQTWKRDERHARIGEALDFVLSDEFKEF